MAKTLHRKDLYEKLTNLLKGDVFGYGDELKAGDEAYEDLLNNGVIANSKGKRIPGKQGRNAADRANQLGKILKSGSPLYVYKKGEAYPREVLFNKETGKLEVSKKPVNELPEMPAPPKPGLLAKYFDFLAKMFGGRVDSCRKWDQYETREKALKNVQDKRRITRRIRNDAALSKQEGAQVNTSAEDAYESFITELKNTLGYNKELTAKGNRGLESLLEEGSIVDKEGRPIPTTDGATREQHVKAIGERLYKQEPLYVYKPGEEYPREVYMDNDGRLKVSDKPINEIQDVEPRPGIFSRLSDRFGWRNEKMFAYERSEARIQLMHRLGTKEQLAMRRALNEVKLGKETEQEPEREKPEINKNQPRPEREQPQRQEERPQLQQQQQPQQMQQQQQPWQMQQQISQPRSLEEQIQLLEQQAEALRQQIRQLQQAQQVKVNNVPLQDLRPQQKTTLMDKVRQQLSHPEQMRNDPEKIQVNTLDAQGRVISSTLLEDLSPNQQRSFLNSLENGTQKKTEQAQVTETDFDSLTPDKQKEMLQELSRCLQEDGNLNRYKTDITIYRFDPNGTISRMPLKSMPPEKQQQMIDIMQQRVKATLNNEVQRIPEDKQVKGPSVQAVDRQIQKTEELQLDPFHPVKGQTEDRVRQEQKEDMTQQKMAQEKKYGKRWSETEQLLATLRAANGGNELSQTVKDNVEKLYQDAAAGEEAIVNGIKNMEDKDRFAGGTAVSAIVADNFVKQTLTSGEADQKGLLEKLEKKDFVEKMQKITRLSPEVVKAADYDHDKEFYIKNILSNEMQQTMVVSVSSSIDLALKENGLQGNFWTAKVDVSVMQDAVSAGLNEQKIVEQTKNQVKASQVNQARPQIMHPLDPNWQMPQPQNRQMQSQPQPQQNQMQQNRPLQQPRPQQPQPLKNDLQPQVNVKPEKQSNRVVKQENNISISTRKEIQKKKKQEEFLLPEMQKKTKSPVKKGPGKAMEMKVKNVKNPVLGSGDFGLNL